MVTAERKAQLTAAGFYVEDMGQEHGPEFAGQFRWMCRNSDDFQDDETSDSEDAAWSSASMFFARNAKLPAQSVAAIAESAINAAVREIQEQLDVPTGDLAGMFFSGELHERLMLIFSCYIRSELAMKEQA